MKIIVASNNQHKIKEIREMMNEFGFEVHSLKDEGIKLEPEETGATFMENAAIKARAVYEYIKTAEKKDPAKKDKKSYRDILVLADDSGLAVDYLGGAPGVYSARYAGKQADDAANNAKLLADLKGVPMEKRTARFVCAMVLVGHKKEIRVQGETQGYVIEEQKGFQGFGYDPLFFSSDLTKTFAEATALEKNSVSHRGRALQELKKELKKL
ncbi:RdgB/HAM1 family non-canonical purine NTP pyrophosphatase [Proteiniclasticum sp. QWL-01]|uniref:RdgB/HAM1 family non-canonical purine NTP pyrophosphatase n=1 Tax=Proteiniclasticum sp. QWL-01 TaxID=3036945 RepID=UPI0021FEBEB4|nr:RdgB/HAM1 family non-canonical purine NTP pyrophosphatase [Proteiniclasticum sp. QWL-01]UUM10769.1 RdgB/HAM1 family non-canonical purine NTP pyrophosphatase [Clostridiaceae bacterium HFYG-1003]WFF72111.1 RdgB/HAM1 family non-canonical purine NTP pyrophosphatase [Proteiniclasticum sp. QWL-01]